MIDRRAGRVLIAPADRAVWEPELAEVKRRFVREDLSAIRRTLTVARSDGRLPRNLDVDLAISTLVGPVVYRQLVLEQEVPRSMVTRVVDDFLARRAPRRSQGRARRASDRL